MQPKNSQETTKTILTLRVRTTLRQKLRTTTEMTSNNARKVEKPVNKKSNYLIDTDACRIPAMDPLDMEVEAYVYKPGP